MDHPFGSPTLCEWKGIILRVIYMVMKLGIVCPLIPETVDVTNNQKYGEWLIKKPEDFPGLPLHNGLLLFLWVINKYSPLFS